MNTLKKKLVTILTAVAVTAGVMTAGPVPSKAAANPSNPTTDSMGKTTWDCIFFGNYFQNSDDTKEPIKWRVLSVNGNDAFLLSDQILDCGALSELNWWPGHSLSEEDYDDSIYGDESACWKNGLIRGWLNEYFYQTAFSGQEQKQIMNTAITETYQATPTSEESITKTTDKIFLLSYDEAKNAKYGLVNNAARTAIFTPYASKMKQEREKSYEDLMEYEEVFIGWDENQWLLRSYVSDMPNMDIWGPVYIKPDGETQTSDHELHNTYGIRPAMHIDLSQGNWKSAGTVSAGNNSSGGMSNPPSNNGGDDGKTGSTTSLPGKCKILSVKNSKKKTVRLSWKKVNGANGYQIHYALKKNMKKAKSCTVKKSPTDIKKLKKNKTYYFRVRAYKKNGNKRIYGKWSKVRKVKIAK